MRLLVATSNPGKLREIADILRGAPVELATLADFTGIPDPDESGATFAENARIKALHYSAATQLATVAEDSGLEIDALDRQPGVQSARWHGTDYAVKFRRIYELLDARGVETSDARFVCHVAMAENGRIVYEVEGVVAGRITRPPRGGNGFGYDPIFYYPPFNCTLAELDLQRKSTVSHRGQAFRALKAHLIRART